MLDAELARGLGAGTAAAAVLLAAVLLTRDRGRSSPLPGAGIAVVGASLWAIGQQRDLPTDVVVGILGVGAACALPALRRSTVAMLAVALPFAYLIAQESSPTGWIRGAVLLSASLGAVAAARTEDTWGPEGVTPALLALTAAGVFAAVPDTEEAAVLLGATVPMALLGWPLRLVTLGPAGAGGATALLAWVVAVGGRGRTPSIVGGLACLGLLVGLAAGRWLRQRSRAPGDRRTSRFSGAPLVLAVHGIVVIVASRVAGISGRMSTAVAVAALTVGLSLVAGTALTLAPGSRGQS